MPRLTITQLQQYPDRVQERMPSGTQSRLTRAKSVSPKKERKKERGGPFKIAYEIHEAKGERRLVLANVQENSLPKTVSIQYFPSVMPPNALTQVSGLL